MYIYFINASLLLAVDISSYNKLKRMSLYSLDNVTSVGSKQRVDDITATAGES